MQECELLEAGKAECVGNCGFGGKLRGWENLNIEDETMNERMEGLIAWIWW